jgi:hypothetical protein
MTKLARYLGQELAGALLDDPPEDAEAGALPELAGPELPAAAVLEPLPVLSDDEPDWLADESVAPALA